MRVLTNVRRAAAPLVSQTSGAARFPAWSKRPVVAPFRATCTVG